MITRSLFIGSLFFALTGMMAAAYGEPLKVDPVHSFVVFQISHLNAGHVWGRVNGPTGTVSIDDANLAGSSVEIMAKAEDLDTANPARDKHLKGPDFFDAKQFPQFSFKSSSIKKTGDNAYEATGTMTLHGVTKPLTVDLTKLGEGEKPKPFGFRAGYETSFTLKRSDFGMGAMTDMIGDDVKITVALEVTRPQ